MFIACILLIQINRSQKIISEHMHVPLVVFVNRVPRTFAIDV